MKKITLSPKQRDTLDFIKSFILEYKKAPTITELSGGLSLKSLRSVTQRLESLEKRGLIKRDSFKHRGISIIDARTTTPSGMMQIPVIASAGCDAAEVYAQEQYGEFLTIDKGMIGNHKDIAAIKAVGNSMVDAGIHNGDYVIVEVTNNVSSGDRVVAILGDMAVIKKLRVTQTSRILEPESKGNGYSPIVMGDNSKIFGKVLSIISMSEPEDDYQLIYDPDVKRPQ